MVLSLWIVEEKSVIVGEYEMRELRKRYGRFGIILILSLLLLPVFAFGELKIHIIDVGQGDAILVQCDGQNLLIDAGPEEGGKVVNDYLTNKADITHLDYVIATHEHDDHLAGMPEALNGLTVQKIYTGTGIPLSYWFKTVLPKVQGNTFSVVRPTQGEYIELGKATVTFFDQMINAENANDLCITIRIDYGQNSILLMADMEGEGEHFLLEQQAALSADILKVGHHGGNTSTSEQFLKAVSPRIAIISVGTGNKHGHPHKEIINRLEKYNVTMYRTDVFGTIILTSDGAEWTVEVSKVG